MNDCKAEATPWQRTLLYSSTILSLLVLSRNVVRINSYSSSYQRIKDIILKGSLPKLINILEGRQRGGQVVVLQTVHPLFKVDYFKHTESNKYRSKVGNFYEGLVFDEGFQGTVRWKDKQYPLWFKMSAPTVGGQLISGYKQFYGKGLRFHRLQMITVVGQIKYLSQKRRGEVEVEMMCLDEVEIDKYWQMKLIAAVLSSFYFGILLGITLSLSLHWKVIDIQNLTSQFSSTTHHQTKDL